MILSITDLKQIRNVSLKEEQFVPYYQEALDIDIATVIGSDVVYSIVQNPGLHATLLNGGIYEVDGVKKPFAGLRKALAYFTYARVVLDSDYNSTNSGFVVKQRDHSERVYLAERQTISRSHQDIGARYLSECQQYMATNTELYPNFAEVDPIRSRIKFTKIG